ncbi:glycoside hydrolase 15 protein, partial [Blyttiomyces sp. JEL0837]
MKLLTVLLTYIAITIVYAANEVKINPNYTYDGYVLSGTATLQNLAFNKVLSINFADRNQEWGFACEGKYISGPDSSNNEQWGFRCVAPETGITQFYAAYSVNGQTFYDSNGGPGRNYQVTKTGVPPPAPPSTGFLNDVSSYLQTAASKAQTYMFQMISPAGGDRGFVAAAPKKQDPGLSQNYFFHWTRDSALVMDVVNDLYKSGSNDAFYEQNFFNFRDFTRRIQKVFDPNEISVYGEPKFEMNGLPYTGDWCRPQLDGP